MQEEIGESGQSQEQTQDQGTQRMDGEVKRLMNELEQLQLDLDQEKIVNASLLNQMLPKKVILKLLYSTISTNYSCV